MVFLKVLQMNVSFFDSRLIDRVIDWIFSLTQEVKNFREKQVDGNVAALLDELNKNFAKLADDLSASKASKGNVTAANQLRKELYDIRLWP